MSEFPIAPIPKPTAYDLECEKLRAEPGGFGAWLKKNPPPDLQALVKKFGGHDKITPHAWAEFDAMSDAWRRAVRLRNGTMPAAQI
jgi:hypothetical protein